MSGNQSNKQSQNTDGRDAQPESPAEKVRRAMGKEIAARL
jgi:hypothetical protein